MNSYSTRRSRARSSGNALEYVVGGQQSESIDSKFISQWKNTLFPFPLWNVHRFIYVHCFIYQYWGSKPNRRSRHDGWQGSYIAPRWRFEKRWNSLHFHMSSLAMFIGL